ncbi:nitrogen fixation protein NifQ [Azospirillum thermophilum]|uniref:Hydrogenase n=1 Tax=Azospirillum thermophilum TaxID=2202148 RepID=A0A2S2CQC0_9PROT|nr:nitrogen fixation protein NifQ [Azospirillum thermophilum]AWK86723.1 hydrogenase [Azospirillum thermophilum]
MDQPNPQRSTDPAEALPAGPALDRLLFGRILDLADAVPHRPLTRLLGLDRAALARLVGRHAPERTALLDGLPEDRGADSIEEPDLRAFLLEHRADAGQEAGEEPEWLAAIVARRSLESNHLWQDMGFASRVELNAMFARHFPGLVALNAGDMKWKKFFYRQLCEREGMMLCKSPNCEVCDDVEVCFGQEDGDPLATLSRIARG